MSPRKESTIEIDEQKLTERERRYLEHVHRAKERGVSLVEHCKELGLNPRSLYSTRRDMVRKGVLPRVRLATGEAVGDSTKKSPGKFAAVRVSAPASLSREDGGLLCRVRHPSGCILELGQWPEAAWMREALEGRGDASA